ncbi:MAG: 1-deoxy-D-xylulose-5-phosphate reductoisomerase [Planctomycetota bacterium]|jgi:1-deoxy-D-xylulose-5-phosphate reductoisomerase
MTGVAILGVTGSIGRSTLDVIRSLGDGYRVVAMSAGSRWEALAEAAAEFRPARVALADEAAARSFRDSGSLDGAVLHAGPDAAAEIAACEDADIVVSAIVGAAGLEPTLAAVRAGKRVALANKEALVMAGGLVLEEARASGATLVPVDSEHSAVFQAKAAGSDREVKRIILTASGGPFRDRGAEEFDAITADEALRHPTWDMGPKITIDSATLMNKALEIIEARWLFDVEPSQIDVWIHPQSVVHSMVEFVDGSVVAQLGLPDMRLPIQYALTYPERVRAERAPLGADDMSRLTFERPDTGRFPALELGWRAAREGGTAGAALNAANEVAAGAFLRGDCAFTDIPRAVETAMDARVPVGEARLKDIWEADAAARAVARRELALPAKEGGT